MYGWFGKRKVIGIYMQGIYQGMKIYVRLVKIY